MQKIPIIAKNPKNPTESRGIPRIPNKSLDSQESQISNNIFWIYLPLDIIIDHFDSYHFANISVFPCFVFSVLYKGILLLRHSLSFHLYKMLSIISLGDGKKRKNAIYVTMNELTPSTRYTIFLWQVFLGPEPRMSETPSNLVSKFWASDQNVKGTPSLYPLILQFVKIACIATSIVTSIETSSHIFQILVATLSPGEKWICQRTKCIFMSKLILK